MRSRWVRSAAVLVASLVVSVGGGQHVQAQASADPVFIPGGDAELRGYKVIFTVQDRDAQGQPDGFQNMYTANGDGSGIRLVQPLGPGVFYDWPTWAFNGTRIVFTARKTVAPGSEEQVFMSRADGSDVQQLTFNSWRNVQPKISPDGRTLLFNSAWPEFPDVGLYRQWLDTGLVEPLSARDPAAYNDADPRWSADGAHVTFASLGRDPNPDRPTQAYMMEPDGSNRQRITTEGWFDTDPALSPDGRYMAISSYRGGGHPVSQATRAGHPLPGDVGNDVALGNWKLVLRNLATGSDVALTQGQDCLRRLPPDVCASGQGPAWVPVWVDGQHIAFTSARTALAMGVYVVNTDGTNARPIIDAVGKVVSWHDWTRSHQPDPPESLLSAIRKTPPSPALLYVAAVHGELAGGQDSPPPALFMATADRWLSRPLTLTLADGTMLTPEEARWTADHQSIVFCARFPEASVPPVSVDRYLNADVPNPDAGLAGQRQIFVMDASSGAVRQLTWPDTQDRAEPIPDGESRDNFDPDVSPDGRYVVFSNYSQAARQTWILRLDLQSGAVVNLSMVNRGVFAGADAHPRVSPDGQRIAVVGTVGFTAQILTMDITGENLQEITNDGLVHAYPAWSPDGRSLAFAMLLPRHNANDPSDTRVLGSWALMRQDLASGAQTTLVGSPLPILWPVWSPRGDQIAYITYGLYLQPDIYVVGADGSDPHPLMITLRSRETFVDWR